MPASGFKPWRFYALWIVGVAVADQVTKYLVIRYIDPYERIVVIPGCFNLVHIYNLGSAFGMFQGWKHALSVLSGLVFIGLLVYQKKFTGDWPLRRLSLGLILGGIIGNMIDRVARIGVVDFLNFYFRQWEWPSFNIADSAIVVGVLFYVWHSFKYPDHIDQVPSPDADKADSATADS